MKIIFSLYIGFPWHLIMIIHFALLFVDNRGALIASVWRFRLGRGQTRPEDYSKFMCTPFGSSPF